VGGIRIRVPAQDGSAAPAFTSDLETSESELKALEPEKIPF
jgi:hypothetical protein